MNLKATYKYQLRDLLKSYVIYYCVIAAVVLLNIVLLAIISDGTVINSFESTTIVFVFIVGLCTFTESFNVSIQNGVSRRTFFVARILSAITAIAAATVIEQLLSLLLHALRNLTPASYNQISLFDYLINTVGDDELVSQVRSLPAMLMSFLSFLGVYSLGSTIQLIFYRLNTLGRVLVGAGVPILLFIVLPVVESFITNGIITSSVVKFIIFATGSFVNLSISLIVVTAIGIGASWLLTRRALVKTR